MTYKPWMANVNQELLARYFCSKAKVGEELNTGTWIYKMTPFGMLTYLQYPLFERANKPAKAGDDINN